MERSVAVGDRPTADHEKILLRVRLGETVFGNEIEKSAMFRKGHESESVGCNTLRKNSQFVQILTERRFRLALAVGLRVLGAAVVPSESEANQDFSAARGNVRGLANFHFPVIHLGSRHCDAT
jgi:hypothetical protein